MDFLKPRDQILIQSNYILASNICLLSYVTRSWQFYWLYCRVRVSFFDLIGMMSPRSSSSSRRIIQWEWQTWILPFGFLRVSIKFKSTKWPIGTGSRATWRRRRVRTSLYFISLIITIEIDWLIDWLHYMYCITYTIPAMRMNESNADAYFRHKNKHYYISKKE